MSAYQEFAEEKEKIDDLVALGYKIGKVMENLSGAYVEFEHPNPPSHLAKTKQLHILTADARKYFGTVLVLQQRSVS